MFLSIIRYFCRKLLEDEIDSERRRYEAIINLLDQAICEHRKDLNTTRSDYDVVLRRLKSVSSN